MSEEINGDTATETAVEAQASNPVLTEASLANLFMTTPKADTQEEIEVDEVEEPEAVEEPEEVSEIEETEIEESDEESEEEEIEEESEEDAEEGDVLSKQDKTVKKMRKRIDKATKNWRTAQEETESLKKENESLKQQLSSTSDSKSSGEQSFKDIASSAENVNDLQGVYDKAEKAEKWIKKAIRTLTRSGEDVLVVNDTEYTLDQIEEFEDEVEQALKVDLPARAKVFEQRQQYDEYALKEFDFLSDPKSDGYKHVETIMGDKDLGAFLSGRADQMQILGLLAEGLISQNAKQSKQSSSGEDKTKDASKKTASTPKIAPSIPFVRSKVANGRKSTSEKSSQVKRDIMNKGNINQRDLTKLFM